MSANNSWGALLPDPDLGIHPGINDQYLDRYFLVDFDRNTVAIATRRGAGAERVRIYQLLPRLFGNVNETRKPNGTLEENGVGKFADLNNWCSTVAALEDRVRIPEIPPLTPFYFELQIVTP